MDIINQRLLSFSETEKQINTKLRVAQNGHRANAPNTKFRSPNLRQQKNKRLSHLNEGEAVITGDTQTTGGTITNGRTPRVLALTDSVFGQKPFDSFSIALFKYKQ